MPAQTTASRQFEAAVHANMGRLIALARSMLGSQMRDSKQAEDMVQDALLKLFRHCESYNWDDGGWSLMAKAVSRNVISCRRRKIGRSLDADDGLYDGIGKENDPAEAPLTAETVELVRQHIALLPDDWRSALVLREQQGMGYREISETLGATESQVKTWLHRARMKLAKSPRSHLEQ